MRYLVTGATGFLGQHLCEFLESKKIELRKTSRNEMPGFYPTGDLTTFSNWADLFKDIDVVVHSAGKAHDMSGDAQLKQKYTEVNSNLTLRLATEAKANHVKTFIFISTIKVNGEETGNTPFTTNDLPTPTDDYGVSKLLAEKKIMALHEPGLFNVVIIRPCLIYGAGVKANFNSLLKMVKKGWPLPFGRIRNKRSLVSVDNLIDLIYTCSINPNASGNIFLVSDGKDLSLTELVITIAKALDKRILLIPIPEFILRLLLTVIGKKNLAQRLFSNLQVDITKTKQILNWSPPFTMEQSLQKIEKGFDHGL